MKPFPTVIVSVLVAFATNIVIDVYTDIPLLLRWVIAIGAGLLVTICLDHWIKRRRGDDERNRATHGP